MRFMILIFWLANAAATLAERRTKFRLLCKAAHLPDSFIIQCGIHGYESVYLLLGYDLGKFRTVTMTAAIIAAFFVSIAYTPTATCRDNFARLIAMARTQILEEEKEVTAEALVSTVSFDPALETALKTGEGRAGRAKTLSDFLYARVKVFYPHFDEYLQPNTMLSPGLLSDLFHCLKGNTQLQNWPNLWKLQTYQMVRSNEDVNIGSGSGNGNNLTINADQYLILNANGAVASDANLKIFMIGLLACVSFLIGPTERGGSGGKIMGITGRYYGTLVGITALENTMAQVKSHVRSDSEYLATYMRAFKEILARLLKKQKHFDEICVEISKDEKYFYSEVMPNPKGKGNWNGKGEFGKGKGGGGGRASGAMSQYKCADFHFGRPCRNNGPPPNGTCRYLHDPNAVVSANYDAKSDPMHSVLQYFDQQNQIAPVANTNTALVPLPPPVGAANNLPSSQPPLTAILQALRVGRSGGKGGGRGIWKNRYGN